MNTLPNTLRYSLLSDEPIANYPPILSTQWWTHGWPFPILSTQWWTHGWTPSDTLYSVMNWWLITLRYSLLSDEPMTDHHPILYSVMNPWPITLRYSLLSDESTADNPPILYSVMNPRLITRRYSLLSDEPTADHPPILSTQWWIHGW